MAEDLDLKSITARLTEKQIHDLDEISDAYGVKRSSLIRMAVAEFIWKHQDLIHE